MTVCKYFLDGRCRYGDRCRFDHPRGGPNQGVQRQLFGGEGPGGGGGQRVTFRDSFGTSQQGQNTSQYKWTAQANKQQKQTVATPSADLVNSLQKEIEIWDQSKQWPFSCLSIDRELPCVPDFEDLSPEELRFEAYTAIKSGNIQTYVTKFQQLSQDYSNKRQQLKNADPQLKQKLIQFIDEHRNKTTPGIQPTSFGGGSSGVYGGGGGGGGGSFGAGAGGMFGSSSESTTSTFGQSAGSTSIFGGGSTGASSGAFGQSSTGTSAFGTGSSSVFGGGSTTAGYGGAGTSGTFGGSGRTEFVTGGSTAFGSGGTQGGFGSSGTTTAFGSGSSAVGFGTAGSTGRFGTGGSSSGFGTAGTTGGYGTGGSTGGLGTSISSSTSGFGTGSSSGQFGSGSLGTSSATPTGVFGGGGFSATSGSSSFGGGTGPSAFSSTPAASGGFGTQPAPVSGPPSGFFSGQSVTTPAASAIPTIPTPTAANSKIYTPLADLTEEEKAQFSAPSFVMSKIPTRPPPRELINL